MSDLELSLEREALTAGEAQYLTRLHKKRKQTHESHTPHGKRLVSRAIPVLAEAIQAFIQEADREGRGRKHSSLPYLKAVEPHIAAAIACRVLIDGIIRNRSLASTGGAIGREINEEVMFTSMNQQAPGLVYRTKQNLDKHPLGYQKNVRRSTLKHVAKKFKVPIKQWPSVDCVRLGVLICDLAVQHLGLFEYLARHEETTKIICVPAVEKDIEEFVRRDSRMHPGLRPMVAVPKPWTPEERGGYLLPEMRVSHSLVRAHGHGSTPEDSRVYEAVNALQSVAWAINPKVLEVVKEIWEADLGIAGLPRRSNVEIPPKPDYATAPELYREWRDKAAAIFRMNAKTKSVRIQAALTINIAERFSKFPAIYFPHSLDFRGRMYPLPDLLNPQASDIAKGLLMFSEGKPVGDEGARWLMIHVANSWGEDKVPFEERIQWVINNREMIESIAADPMRNLSWTEADKPFQFLAASLEMSAFWKDGTSMKSNLSISLDGSCNGLQHFSALLRDAICGSNVNLVPGQVPADIYAEVARVTTERLKIIASNDEDQLRRQRANEWLQWGIDRDTCKRPVMVLPYGGTMEAARKYVLDHTEDDKAIKKKGRFPGHHGKAAVFLSRVMWDAMKEVVVGPIKAMDWLRGLPRLAGAQPITWITPAGFRVRQVYNTSKTKKIELATGEKMVVVKLLQPTDDIDTRKMAQAIAPNFVHSLDAAALMLTILRLREEGIHSFAAVHDSYGTHACDVSRLAVVLREVFVQMYEEHDPLQQLHDEVSQLCDKQPEPVPTKGLLNLQEVKDSPFFFA